MATNKNARLRYEALDKCLSNFSRKFYIEDLQQAVCQYLKEQLSEEMSVSIRQIYQDLKEMEINPGMNAPIKAYKVSPTSRKFPHDMRSDGFSLTIQRIPQSDRNDIPDLISRFHNPEAEMSHDCKGQSFFVDADEIRENDYDLSYKRYHEVEREIVEYDSPENIISRMKERQAKIDSAFAEFQNLLNS